MSDDDELDEDGYPIVHEEDKEVELTKAGKPRKAKKAGDPVKTKKFGEMWYGETFQSFQKIRELQNNLAAFKDFYYSKKVPNLEATNKEIIMAFNETIAPERFHPYPAQLRNWTKKWDKNILEQLKFTTKEMVKREEVHQVIRTRANDQALAYATPEDDTLEAGVRTLGGELLNDAFSMLRNDQELEEIFDTDELIKRRNYVLNVFGHTTRMVQGKAALMLKASQEKRETASFLMDLMREAASGKLSKEKLDILKSTAVAPVAHEHVVANAG